MATDRTIFAGVDVSSGRKPVTFAALDDDLNVLELQHLTLAESAAYLMKYNNIVLAINSTVQGETEFKKTLSQAGVKPLSRQSSRQWMDVDAQDCFRALCPHNLLPRRSLEGRIQRALLLYDEQLQLPDPMDFFEEITRHKLMQGILPQEGLHSIRDLDALVSAYTAWMLIREPGRVHVTANRAALLQSVDEPPA